MRSAAAGERSPNYFASRGSHVTGISLSDEQLHWASSRQAGSIDFRHQDYRDVEGQFDAIVSVEMVEAVGREYWPSYFDCLARCLKPGGRAAIQFIAMREELFDGYARNADFIQAYIFPGGLLIRTSEFRKLAAERGLSWEDQEDFGLDYAETLKAWRENFDRACDEERLPAGFDERFCRLWRFYLMYCEGGFRGEGITVSQVTLVKTEASAVPEHPVAAKAGEDVVVNNRAEQLAEERSRTRHLATTPLRPAALRAPAASASRSCPDACGSPRRPRSPKATDRGPRSGNPRPPEARSCAGMVIL